jgi:hypothetical protein
MIAIAHVGGVPVEELIPTVAGAGSMVLLARGWLSLRLRRHRGLFGFVTAPPTDAVGGAATRRGSKRATLRGV